MNIALLTAGGTGERMKSKTPKQFMKINGKPLIVYTAERFQDCDVIDEIVISCLSGWEDYLKETTASYKLNKVKYVVTGGKTGLESIRNGLERIRNKKKNNSLIVIHDGNRPLVTNEIIKRAVDKCKEKGNAVGYIPCQEVTFLIKDRLSSKKQIDRSKLVRTQTPHVYYLNELLNVFENTKKETIEKSVAMCSLYAELGKESYFYLGSEKNIKITTSEDIDLFKALLKQTENE